MVCKKCGKELAEGTKKCDGCGAKVKLKFSELPQKEKKKRIIVGSLCLAVAAVLIIAGAIGAMDKTDEYVLAVTEGTLSDFSDKVTVGEAFEDFFDNPEWKSFEDEDGRIIVEFNGECTWKGEAADCCVQFEIDEDDGTFEVSYAEVDGNAFDEFEIIAMLEVIYEG